MLSVQAALKIKRYEEARDFCVEGLKVDPENSELSELLTKAQQGLAKANKEKEEREAKVKRAAMVEKARLEAVTARGVRMVERPEWLESTYHLDLQGADTFYIDDDQYLHWAVIQH